MENIVNDEAFCDLRLQQVRPYFVLHAIPSVCRTYVLRTSTPSLGRFSELDYPAKKAGEHVYISDAIIFGTDAFLAVEISSYLPGRCVDFRRIRYCLLPYAYLG